MELTWRWPFRVLREGESAIWVCFGILGFCGIALEKSRFSVFFVALRWRRADLGFCGVTLEKSRFRGFRNGFVHGPRRRRRRRRGTCSFFRSSFATACTAQLVAGKVCGSKTPGGEACTGCVRREKRGGAADLYPMGARTKDLRTTRRKRRRSNLQKNVVANVR